MPLLGAIAGGAMQWVPLLDAIAGCHCWVPLLGCHCWGAIAGCHRGVPWLDAIAACHCEKPLREKIDQSVTPLSAALFSALITHTNWLVLSGVYAGIISFFLLVFLFLVFLLFLEGVWP